MAHRSTQANQKTFFNLTPPLTWMRSSLTALSQRLFAGNDTAARGLGWQVTVTHWGLGRQYRDRRFDVLVPGQEQSASLPRRTA
jgi:hypothetical protein